jgi:Protein of unknown function (DUF4199)
METTSTPAVSPLAAGIRYGIIFGIVGILVDFVLKLTGLSFKYSVSLSVMIIQMVVAIVLAHRYFKSNNAGFMSYGQGLVIAIVAGALMGLLGGVFNYIYINFIDTNYTEAMRADMEAWLISMKAPEEQIDKSLADITPEKVGSPLGIGKAMLGGAFISLLLSLIISAITKRNRPEFE